jgi:hypothetical protein
MLGLTRVFGTSEDKRFLSVVIQPGLMGAFPLLDVRQVVEH